MAQKKPAWQAFYTKNANPEQKHLIRVGGLISDKERGLQEKEQKRKQRQQRRKERKRKFVHGFLNVSLVTLLVLLIGGAVAVGVIQTIQVQEKTQTSAEYAAQAENYAQQVKELQTQVENLTAKNEKLRQQAQSAGVPTTEGGESSFDYQKLYPNLIVADMPQTPIAPADKTVYLTFDDGPSSGTADILDVLKEQNAKATFFVTGANVKGNEALLQRMIKEGHSIGLHTYSHLYDSIYKSVDDFLADVNKSYEAIYNACGTYPTIFRFAGGSINRYNGSQYHPYIAEMLRRGFRYYDWNVAPDIEEPETTETKTDTKSSDTKQTSKTTSESTTAISAKKLSAKLTAGIQGAKYPMVLLYDAPGKTTTAAAVEQTITKLKEQGYTFAALTNDVQPITFTYP